MTATPPVLLVLDVSALSATTPREWLEFSRVGVGHVPQLVYEEMRFLFDRSPDPDLERVSRAFTRFYPTSGWQITDESAHHPALKVVGGQAMTKRARVSQAVARCAYGLALNHPASLVVLVTADRSLLQRLFEIQVSNLCGVTGPTLMQWSRSGQRPIIVSQKLQQMRVPGKNHSSGRSASQVSSPTSPVRITAGTPPKTAIQTKTTIQSPTKVSTNVTPKWKKYAASGWWVALVAAIGLAAWAMFNTTVKQNSPKPPSPVSDRPALFSRDRQVVDPNSGAHTRRS
jgi:hypothetical protein